MAKVGNKLSISVNGAIKWLDAHIVKASSAGSPVAVFLHGAGGATLSRTKYLATQLEQAGISSISFNFSGAGSSDAMHGFSLQDRIDEAAAVITQSLPEQRDLTVIGSSMSGHIAARLTGQLRIKNLCLFCPAAYPEFAEGKAFGDPFRQAISSDWDFAHSPAFDDLREFDGRFLMVTGSYDEVIPPEIIKLYWASSRMAAQRRHIVLQNCPHGIHSWLPKQAGPVRDVEAALIKLIRG